MGGLLGGGGGGGLLGGILGGGGGGGGLLGGLTGGGGLGNMFSGMPVVGGLFGGSNGYPNTYGGPPADLTQGSLGGYTPQGQGYGIGGPYPNQPYSTGPGLTNQPANIQGGDLSRRGSGENWYRGAQGQFSQPTQTSQQWNQSQGYYSQPTNSQGQYGQAQGQLQRPSQGQQFAQGALAQYQGRTPQVTANSQSAYGQFQGNRPDIRSDPGLDPYYQNAARRTTEGINRQMAAMGMMGSGANLDRVSEALTDLGAQQANREADYHLQRLGEQRAWEGLGLNAAGQADSNSLMQSQNARDWMSGLGNLAFGADQSQLGRLGMLGQLAGQADTTGLQRMQGGMSGAGQADATALNWLGAGGDAAYRNQAANQGRVQQLFGNQMSLGGALAPMIYGTGNQMLDTDMALMNGSLGAQLGLGAGALNQDYMNKESHRQGFGDLMSLGTSMLGGGGGGMFGGLLGG